MSRGDFDRSVSIGFIVDEDEYQHYEKGSIRTVTRGHLVELSIVTRGMRIRTNRGKRWLTLFRCARTLKPRKRIDEILNVDGELSTGLVAELEEADTNFRKLQDEIKRHEVVDAARESLDVRNFEPRTPQD